MLLHSDNVKCLVLCICKSVVVIKINNVESVYAEMEVPKIVSFC